MLPSNGDEGQADAADRYQGFADSVGLFRRRGWFGTLPLWDPILKTGRSKTRPPKGFTGHDGAYPSAADCEEWKADPRYHDSNLAIRHPDIVIALDVDHYGDKHGGVTIAEAEKRWGALPTTYISTARPERAGMLSGRRLYRVPTSDLLPDVLSLEIDGKTFSDVEIIQRSHRYSVMRGWNPDSKSTYQLWLDGELVDDAGLPRPHDLTYLPDDWFENLEKLHRAKHSSDALAAPSGPVGDAQWRTKGIASKRVEEKLAEAIADLSGGSRYPHTTKHVMTLMRYGFIGDGGVGHAVDTLRHHYVQTVADERPGGAKAAVDEYDRCVRDAVPKLALQRNKTSAQPPPNLIEPPLSDDELAAIAAAKRATPEPEPAPLYGSAAVLGMFESFAASEKARDQKISDGLIEPADDRERKIRAAGLRRDRKLAAAGLLPPQHDRRALDKELRAEKTAPLQPPAIEHRVQQPAMTTTTPPRPAVVSDVIAEAAEEPPPTKETRVPLRVITNNGEPLHPLNVEHVEGDFWTCRESLAGIYATAMGRMTSPWAVLGTAVPRALALVRPNCTLPPLIGGPGSLNFFAALVGISGGGKGSAGSVAADLVPLPESVPVLNLGSGEGIVQGFVVKANDEHPDGRRESVMFNVTEVDNMGALQRRTASTTMSVLRQGFSGETIGFQAADRAKATHIKGGTYRMTMVLHVQPERAGAILDGADGGTPQRILWLPATDQRVNRKHRSTARIRPLTLPRYHGSTTDGGVSGVWTYDREIRLCDEAADEILTAAEARAQGRGDALDGHALYVREKFAYGLAVLDGRHEEITSEDWRLAGIAAEVSTHVRDAVVRMLDHAQREAASERGALRGVENEAADYEKTAAAIERSRRVRRWVMAKLDESEGRGVSNRDLSRAVASRDRQALKPALSVLEMDGLIVDNEGTWEKLK